MTSSIVDLSIVLPGIAQVTLQDTEHKNTFTQNFIDGLQNAFQKIAEDDTIKTVILTGYDSYFACGGTQESLLHIQKRNIKFTDTDLYSLALKCPVPVIAAMQGHAIGGGFALGMFADLIIFSKESIYTANFMQYGFTPGMGATLVLPKKLGPSIGIEMLLTANRYYGGDLLKRGITYPVLPRSEVLPYALRLAKSLAQKPRKSLVTLKSHLVSEYREELPSYIDKEAAMHEVTFHLPEVKTLIESLYGKTVDSM